MSSEFFLDPPPQKKKIISKCKLKIPCSPRYNDRHETAQN